MNLEHILFFLVIDIYLIEAYAFPTNKKTQFFICEKKLNKFKKKAELNNKETNKPLVVFVYIIISFSFYYQEVCNTLIFQIQLEF